jgi:6-pyruvoyl-tetrahydropterin synthase
VNQLFVKHLTVIDFSYLSQDRIVGESYIVDIILSGSLDSEGVIFDFSYAKKLIKSFIDSNLDHTLVYATKQKNLTVFNKSGQIILELNANSKSAILYESPKQATCAIETDKITLSNVEQYLQSALKAILPANISQIEVILKIEDIKGSFFNYSHGLRKHYGNCQRMAHGHRSAIELSVNNIRDLNLEQYWANVWDKIYIGNNLDILKTDETHYFFQYESSQGLHFLKIPIAHCYLLNTDTTIEQISEYLANKIKESNMNNLVKVQLYEGVNKGAIYTC